MMNRILTPILALLLLAGLSERVMAASIAVLDLTEITGAPIDFTAFSIPKEESKNMPFSSAQTFSLSDQHSFTASKPVAENENYIFQETSKLQSVAFTLSCIALLGLIFVRRFKRAFI